MCTKALILAFLCCLAMSGLLPAQILDEQPYPSIEARPATQSRNALGRHHISVGVLGYFKSTSGDFELPAWGIDASEGSSASLNYRYSFTRNFDMAVDIRGWTSELTIEPVTITTTVAGLGCGIRYTADGIAGRIYPYVQVNGYSLTEQIEVRVGSLSDTGSENGFGYAANAGIELRLGSLISVPIEAFYLGGEPADDVSGWGVTGGISFNWGSVE